jgi:hypothetical protein
MRVLVLDDHRLFLDGVSALLQRWREGVCLAACERVAEDGMSAAFFERTWVRLRQAGRLGPARGRDGA